MASSQRDQARMAVVQDGALINKAKMSPEQAVRDLASEGRPMDCLAFDIGVHRWNIEELASWISEFKQYYETMLIRKRRASVLPSIAVFADRFSGSDAAKLRHVGAVLFDRSLACNKDCQTPEQMIAWLGTNANVRMAAVKSQARALPSAPPKGISADDLNAINSYPPGRTPESVRNILRILNRD